MGGSTSKSVVNQISQQITDAAINTVQSCEQIATQTQNLNAANTGFRFWSTYRLEQQTDISVQCFSDVKKQTDLQNKIIGILSQNVTAEGVALWGAFGKTASEAQANISSLVKTNITMTNIQKTYSAIAQHQTANFSNSGVILFDQVSLTQGSKIFAAATLQEVDKAGIFNTLEQYIDNSASSKQAGPFDFIANIFGSIASGITGTIMFFILIIIGAILGVIVLFKIIGSMGGPSNPQQFTQQVRPQNNAQLNTQPLPNAQTQQVLSVQSNTQSNVQTLPNMQLTQPNTQSTAQQIAQGASTVANVVSAIPLPKKLAPIKTAATVISQTV